MKKLFSILLVLMLTGCLKTRNEVRDEEYQQSMQTQAIDMQKASSSKELELQDEYRSLSGRVEVLEKNLKSQNDEINKNTKQRTQDVDHKIEAYQEALEKLQQQVAQLSSEVETLKLQPKAIPSNDKKKSSIDEGQDYFDKKEWKKAIVSFQKYREENLKGKQYAHATYLIGVSFHELGMKEEARTFFAEVVEKFPKSPEAAKAKSRLKK